MRRLALVASVVIVAALPAHAATAPFERTFSGSGLHARVALLRPLVGTTTLRVRLTDMRDRTVRGARVFVHIDMVSMAMNPPGDAQLREGRAGTYERTVRLTMPGHWKADVKIVRPGAAATTLRFPFFVDLP